MSNDSVQFSAPISTGRVVTEAQITQAIKTVTYATLVPRSIIMCEITLHNGHTVIGIAGKVDPEGFDEDIGKHYSYQNAREKLWELLGYVLCERLFVERNVDYTESPEPRVIAVEKHVLFSQSCDRVICCLRLLNGCTVVADAPVKTHVSTAITNSEVEKLAIEKAEALEVFRARDYKYRCERACDADDDDTQE